jgi:hypothetical protein
MPRAAPGSSRFPLGFAMAAIGMLAPDATACVPSSKSTVVALQVSQPVLDTPDDQNEGFELRIDAAGCVRARYPAWDLRAGVYALQLPPNELAALRMALLQTGVASFQTERVQAELLQRQAFAPRLGSSVRISDAEAIRLEMTPPGKASAIAIEWHGLLEQRLAFPDHSGLAALEAAIRILKALGTDPRLEPLPER